MLNIACERKIERENMKTDFLIDFLDTAYKRVRGYKIQVIAPGSLLLK